MYGEIMLQLICKFQSDFLRKLQHSVGMLKERYKEDFECSYLLQLQVSREVE